MRIYYFAFILLLISLGCNNKNSSSSKPEIDPEILSQYSGSGNITQGFAETKAANIFECENGRKAGIGSIESSSGRPWIVPASNNFTNEDFPWASDLHNPCNGNTYSNVEEALSKLDGSDIIEINPNGEIFTTYVFADNYFEMYVNGIPVGKDNVPFTQFNSNIVRFKVNKPFLVAMKLVDWEEYLGLGSEKNRNHAFHAGDGGMVAVIKDEKGKIVATTNEKWKAQTFYTSPIKELSCLKENGSVRSSDDCDARGTNEGASFYGVHWDIPNGWEGLQFNDSNWPNANAYTNETIGVDNKKAYTNFTNLFDDKKQDAQFIWSSNVVLDNEVIVRYLVF